MKKSPTWNVVYQAMDAKNSLHFRVHIEAMPYKKESTHGVLFIIKKDASWLQSCESRWLPLHEVKIGESLDNFIIGGDALISGVDDVQSFVSITDNFSSDSFAAFLDKAIQYEDSRDRNQFLGIRVPTWKSIVFRLGLAGILVFGFVLAVQLGQSFGKQEYSPPCPIEQGDASSSGFKTDYDGVIGPRLSDPKRAFLPKGGLNNGDLNNRATMTLGGVADHSMVKQPNADDLHQKIESIKLEAARKEQENVNRAAIQGVTKDGDGSTMESWRPLE